MERIGDQAADIAEIVAYVDLTDNINNLHIKDMAKATIKMVTDSIDSFVKRDLKLAEQVIAYDDVVDDLFCKIKKDVIALITDNPEQGEQYVVPPLPKTLSTTNSLKNTPGTYPPLTVD